MAQGMKVQKHDVWHVAGKAFPEYTGRKFSVEYADKFTAHDLNWGGGTRNSYSAVNLDTGEVNSTGPIPAPWAHSSEGKTHSIPLRWAVVVHSFFCGKDVGLRVIVNKEDGVKWLTHEPLEVQ